MDCVHHWKIETPNGGPAGGWSAGSCIHCGENRQFRNSSPDWGRPREKSLAKGTGRRWGHRRPTTVTPEIDVGVQGR